MPAVPFDTDFAESIYNVRYRHPDDHNWFGTAQRVTGAVVPALYHAPKAQSNVSFIADAQERLYGLVAGRLFIPGGRYLYASGRDLHQVNNCILLGVEDSREGWADLSHKAEMASMTGAGIGVWYGKLRRAGSKIGRTGGEASGPMGKMMMVNDMGRYILQGGNRRSAIWAGLPWWHADVFEFITCKDWPDWLRERKEQDWTIPAPMDTTNISVTLDDAFFAAYAGDPSVAEAAEAARARESGLPAFEPEGGWVSWARNVYWTSLRHMLRHGEPGFTVDVGDKADEVLRNACTEITSADDSDVCNLGSLVLPRFDTPESFGRAVRDAVLFLTAGTLYSDVPYDKIREVREKNRRLGLGIIGLHEFLMKHGVRYGTPEAFEVLEPYMLQFSRAREWANEQQDKLGLSYSVAATAEAPNGTIGIVAESTPSADPLFSAAEIRTVTNATPHGNEHEQHIVVDPTAARLVREGVPVSLIEDSYTLSLYPERRLAQQAYLQRHIDHSVSSTINLPAPVESASEARALGESLMKYLPQIRGVTFYPNGARAGQPRTPCDLEWALEREGTVLETEQDICVAGACGV